MILLCLILLTLKVMYKQCDQYQYKASNIISYICSYVYKLSAS